MQQCHQSEEVRSERSYRSQEKVAGIIETTSKPQQRNDGAAFAVRGHMTKLLLAWAACCRLVALGIEVWLLARACLIARCLLSGRIRASGDFVAKFEFLNF